MRMSPSSRTAWTRHTSRRRPGSRGAGKPADGGVFATRISFCFSLATIGVAKACQQFWKRWLLFLPCQCGCWWSATIPRSPFLHAQHASVCRTTAIGRLRVPMCSIFTLRLTFMSARATRTLSGYRWRRPWRAACQRLLPFVRASPTMFTMVPMALFFANRATLKR